MKDRGKKIFLAASVIVPFMLYCGYYYGMMVKNAPYKFSEFESFTYRYGTGDSLLNQYDSKTQNYQYIDSDDSLVKTKLKLTKDDLLYLHRKATDYGFWDFPTQIRGRKDQAGVNSPHYYIKFKYKRKSKEVYFDLNYDGNPKLKDAVRVLIETINKSLDEAQARTETNKPA
ncbi:hypothetical protein [Arcticibacter eurypsychrophilus]|uniref:hypothetical protein n=1 Tax=Arcticibacter eurypsychrophilus TaxID=1434752 RepID=UPI0009F48321|nr:hypothetical protein [Arcticibacter eurypsychrophilus]